jgi:hypothetical protein
VLIRAFPYALGIFLGRLVGAEVAPGWVAYLGFATVFCLAELHDHLTERTP